VLLARRLAQAGVPFIQVNWCRMPGDTDDSPAWDTHNKNAQRLKSPLMPIMDAAYSALLEDLHQRGMLDETLVVWCGEFGRTPRHNPGSGRDHWGHVFSAALAGGGIRGGVVHGASDRMGGHPKDGRVEPQDLWATVLDRMGIEPETEFRDPQGRPFPTSRGRVIEPLLA
jgi:arylsulfatase A-like enzyme